MKRAFGSEHAYSPASNDNTSRVLNAWRRLRASQWVALMGLTTLLGATTVNAFVMIPRALPFTADEGGLPPEMRADLERQLRAMVMFPCHELPGTGDGERPISLVGGKGLNAAN